MFDIDMILEAAKEDPQTYRDLAKFARENPIPKASAEEKRAAYEQARADATKGAARDARDTKRVSDYAKVGGVTTMGDLAAKYEERRVSARELAMATAKVERTLGYQNDKGDDINVKNARAHLDKALSELLSATQRASKAGILNGSQSGSLKEFIKDCRELDTDDEVEMNSKLRELISDTNRWKIPMLTKNGEKMVSIASLVPDSSRPIPANTPYGSEKAAWLRNVHGENGEDHRDTATKKNDKKLEDASMESINNISRLSMELRDKIRNGEEPEGTTIKQYAEKIAKENNEKIEKRVSNRYVDSLQNIATKQKLKELSIPTMTEVPVDGCKNVKDLVKHWAATGKNSIIELAYRPAKQSSGVGKNETMNKPIVYIYGEYYQVPEHDLYTGSRGGIAAKNSPYLKYVKKAYKDPKHAELRNKLKIHTSVDTDDTVEESVKNWFNY